MKFWAKDSGSAFTNDKSCYGMEYQPASGRIDIARVIIKGEYPKSGSWGRLGVSQEIAMVITGHGRVECKDGTSYDLQVGDVVYIEPHEWFRWVGDMELIMACAPKFDPKKREEMTDEVQSQ